MADSYPKIFINYRRKDARGLVEKLYEYLSSIYGEEAIFFDQNNIIKGAPITDTIQQKLKHCDLFIPVIGPNWDRQSYLKRLNEPMDWVRQEMELAIELKKQILPILIDREFVPDSKGIPNSINYQAIFDINGIKLKEDTQYWDEEIKRYAEIIQSHTGLQPKKIEDHSSADEQYIEQICFLNRHTEYGIVKNPNKNSNFMFAGSGSERSGFNAFAKRCSLEILAGTEIKNISWNQFDNMPNARARKSELLDMLGKALVLEVNGLEEQDKIKMLQEHFRNKKYVFRCTRFSASSNNHNKGSLQEWWTIWKSLIGDDLSSSVLVLLFTVPGWKLRFNLFTRFPKHTEPENLGSFKAIKQSDVKSWKNGLVKPFNDFLPDQAISKLFFMNGSRDFQDIEEGLLQAMKKVQRRHLDN